MPEGSDTNQITVVTLNGLERVSGEESAQFCELRSDSKHLVTCGSMSL